MSLEIDAERASLLPTTEGPFLHPRVRWLKPLQLGGSLQRWKAAYEGPRGFRRIVTVKCTVGEPTPEVCEALTREARAYARLDHRSLPRLLDFHEEKGHLVLITTHVTGVLLEDVLDWQGPLRTRMPLLAAYHLGARLFAALHAIHTGRDPGNHEFSPVVHQSISPATITVTPTGELFLDDFGRSRTLVSPDLTPSGLLGTNEGYLAPEQILGGRPSVRTDVYSACVVLRELILGRPAFPRGDRDYLRWMDEIANTSLGPIEREVADVDPEVAWLLRVGLRRDMASRALTASIAAEILAPLAIAGGAALSEHLAKVRPPGLVDWIPPPAIRESTPRRLDSVLPARREPVPQVTHPASPRPVEPPPIPRTSRAPALQVPTPVALAHSAPPPSERATDLGLPAPSRRSRVWLLFAAAAAFSAAGLAVRWFTPQTSLQTAPATWSAGLTVPTTVAAAAPAVSAAPSLGSRIVNETEGQAILRLVHAEDAHFERCFSSADGARTGYELRTRCADRPTLTLLRVEAAPIAPRRIGAFTCAPLAKFSGKWAADSHATLFAIDPLRAFPIRTTMHAVDNRDGHSGPTFGSGHDLQIMATLQSGTSYPRSYLHSPDGANFVGRYGNFRVRDLEVFAATSVAVCK